MAQPDHLVLAARNLDAGAAWLEDRLGTVLDPGGRHVRMGTHNRLLRLGEDFYMELIAVDPAGDAPGRPRWFGLDELTLADDRPRLIHWVARCEDITVEAARCHHDPGRILDMERGDFRWRITVPDDGRLTGNGLVPTLIQWTVPGHPARLLPDRGCSLMKLEAFHADPDSVRAALGAMGLAASVDLHASDDRSTEFIAYLKAPRGLVELD